MGKGENKCARIKAAREVPNGGGTVPALLNFRDLVAQILADNTKQEDARNHTVSSLTDPYFFPLKCCMDFL